LVNQGAANLSFTSLKASDTSGNVDSDHTGSTTVTYTADADNVTAKTATAKAADYTFAQATGALTVAVGEYVDTTGANITAAKASSVTLTVATGKTPQQHQQKSQSSIARSRLLWLSQLQ